MKKTRICITMLCIILTMLVIFMLPAVADEVVFAGSDETLYGDGEYKPTETDFVYGNETDFEGEKNSEWVGVETDVFPEEASECVEIVMDNMNKIYNNDCIYELRVFATGAPTSSFVMDIRLPWFVTVKDVRFNEELTMAKNAIYEKIFNENNLTVSYSSAVNFAETDLFYIEFMINSTGDLCDSTWLNFAQFVNDDAVEVECSFRGGNFNISDKKIIKGDVTLDGYVQLDDVMYLLRYLTGYEMNFSDIQWSAADVDNDGSITIIDCQYIQNYIVGKIDSLENVNGCKHVYDENGKCMLCGEYGGSGDEPSDEPEQECKHLKTTAKVIKEPNCTKVGYVQYSCGECGYSWREVIEPNGNHVYDENGVCTYCGASTDIPETPECEHLKAKVVKSSEPTCIKNGFAQYQCPECGYMWKETIPTTDYHNYDSSGVCIDCGEGVVNPEAPNCNGLHISDGNGTCINCGASRIEYYPSLDNCEHNDMYAIETVEPTCGKGGYIWYQCSSCSYQLKKILLATGEHEYDAKGICMNCGKVDGEPMECDHASAYEFKYYGYECREDYTVSYRCPDCNYVFEKIGPAEDSIHHHNGTDNCVDCGVKIECKHNMVESEWLDATCGEHGYIIAKCIDCGFTYKSMTHATGNHIYDENGNCVNCDKFISGSTNCDHSVFINCGWRSPSCNEDGYKTYICFDCNQIWEVTVPNIDGHDYRDGGETCVYCGHQKDDLIENSYVTVN